MNTQLLLFQENIQAVRAQEVIGAYGPRSLMGPDGQVYDHLEQTQKNTLRLMLYPEDPALEDYDAHIRTLHVNADTPIRVVGEIWRKIRYHES